MMAKKFSVVCLVLIILASVMSLRPVNAVETYERILGSDFDTTVFTWAGLETTHNVATGFGTAISMIAPIEPGDGSFTKAAFAVELCDPFTAWILYQTPLEAFVPIQVTCHPTVEEMWVSVAGNSYYWPAPNQIVDNTGTGGECSFDWVGLFVGVLIDVLAAVLFELRESPPAWEWDPEPHSVKATVREGEVDIPPLQSAGANFYSLFSKKGYNTLTITAEASIIMWYLGYYAGTPVTDCFSIGTYSLNFEVSVPVTNAPDTPYRPDGPTSGYTCTTYGYSTTTIDPNGDDVRYEFAWGDDSTTTTGWYASGAPATASHSWSSSGTYSVMVRAQDVYGEYSSWSPYLSVTISTSSGGGGGGGGGGWPPPRRCLW